MRAIRRPISGALFGVAAASFSGSSHADERGPALPRGDAATFGLVGIVARSASPAKATQWWLRDDLGPRDQATAAGKMWVTSIADAAGAPGLSLSNASIGTRGDAISGTTAVATVGGGDANLDVDAFDHGRRLLQARHVGAMAPSTGSKQHTPPDVIQRIVRDNFGRFEVCYAIGRRLHPALAGRVAVKFVIDHRGAVAMASDAGSDLPDASVVACVVRAFDTLLFPQSPDSAVTVVYPVVFSPRPDAS